MMGNRLTFEIDFDQTELPAVLRGLDAICAPIPVVETWECAFRPS